MTLEVEAIPPSQRYGYCENCSTVDPDDPAWHSYGWQRKPVVKVNGERLCRRCSQAVTA